MFGRKSNTLLLMALYTNCPCKFKNWNSLHTHLHRTHKDTEAPTDEIHIVTFTCLLCGCNDLATEKTYYEHVYTHLKNNETVQCMFKLCNFESNVSSTFRSHKHRLHSVCTIEDFKDTIVTKWSTIEDVFNPFAMHNVGTEDDDEAVTQMDEDESNNECEDLMNKIEHKIASILLKIENILHVSSTAVDELVEELSYVSLISKPLIEKTLNTVLRDNNCNMDSQTVEKLAHAVSTHNPISQAFNREGPLSTAYLRKEYYKSQFEVIMPVQHDLENSSFQYIPILPSLQKLLDNDMILDKVVDPGEAMHSDFEENGENKVYRTFKDGQFFQQNELLGQDGFQISLGLYIDDFEVCNPLGTSRNIHKICAVYWTLNNLPAMHRSSLSSINLALLCTSSDVKEHGYTKVLKPLLDDLVTLEEMGVYVAKLDKHIKGTVQCVAADNLGAHSLAGFVESFKANYFCRYCTAQQNSFQLQEASEFQLRTKEAHSEHISLVQESETLNNYCGVKKPDVLTENLKYFHVLEGYPPDVLHDFFEGIVPFELALCLKDLIAKKYITVDSLNEALATFDYQHSDKRDKPHRVSSNIASSKTLGGNGHENWTFIRLLPLLIGPLIPENEPVWDLLNEP